MSSAVPTGPLMPRSGYRAISSSRRRTATRSSSAAVAKRLPRVVAWAATLCDRPASTKASYSAARRARRARAARALIRTSRSELSTWSCSTFSVRSRLVMPLWICSCPASAANSSMRAFTSCRVTRSRAAIASRSTASVPRSTTASYASIAPSGTSTPSSACARRTASHSRRSSTTLWVGDHSVAMSVDAYRPARTFGMAGFTAPFSREWSVPAPSGPDSDATRWQIGPLGMSRGQEAVVGGDAPQVVDRHAGGGRRLHGELVLLEGRTHEQQVPDPSAVGPRVQASGDHPDGELTAIDAEPEGSEPQRAHPRVVPQPDRCDGDDVRIGEPGEDRLQHRPRTTRLREAGQQRWAGGGVVPDPAGQARHEAALPIGPGDEHRARPGRGRFGGSVGGRPDRWRGRSRPRVAVVAGERLADENDADQHDAADEQVDAEAALVPRVELLLRPRVVDRVHRGAISAGSRARRMTRSSETRGSETVTVTR